MPNLRLTQRRVKAFKLRKPAKDAVRGKLKRAAWNDDFLLNLIRAAA